MQYYLENDLLSIAVDTTGAELASLKNRRNNYEYLWQGDPQYWERRSPVLFPIVGGLIDGFYRYRDRKYHMDRHGFAKDMAFQLSEEGQDRLSFVVSHHQTTLRQYPFKFILKILYTLHRNTLSVEYLVKNTDRQTIWFSIGGHPGFNCGLKPDRTAKDGRLIFPEAETANRIVNEFGFLTGSEEPFLKNQSVIDLSFLEFNQKTNVYILKNLKSESVTLHDGFSNRNVTVRYQGFPYLGIWSPAVAAPFICIEPWQGLTATMGGTDILNRKQGIQKLKPDASFSCRYEIVCD